MDEVFKALADASRRSLLDRLHARNGQTLNELCEGLAMTRQAVTKHLAILEEANLVSTIRHGREKLHYLNPVPIHQIGERWIKKFDRAKFVALSELKRMRKEDDAKGVPPMDTAKFRPAIVYTIYIASTPERVWQALTSAEFSRKYFFGNAVAVDLKVGGAYIVRTPDGALHISGEVIECEPQRKLTVTFNVNWPALVEKLGPTLVTYEI